MPWRTSKISYEITKIEKWKIPAPFKSSPSSAHCCVLQWWSWQQNEDHQSLHGLCLQRDFILAHPAIVIKFAQCCNNSKTLMECFWFACVPHFPLWPIVLTFLSAPLWNSGWQAFLHSSLPPPLLLAKCIQISLSKIQSSYVKDKRKQTSKRRNAACKGFSHFFQPQDPLHHQNGSSLLEENPILNLVFDFRGLGTSPSPLCFVPLDGSMLCGEPWPLPTHPVCMRQHTHTCMQTKPNCHRTQQERRRKPSGGKKDKCAESTFKVSSLTD